MIRSRQSFALFRATGAIVILALLAACSNGASTTRNGASRYAGHTHGNYTPPGPPEDPWGPYISEASARFDIPDQWIRALMRQESGGREYAANGQLITSSAGAMGLMQVMPGTYEELRARHNLGEDPYEPHDNIMAGVAYMREMYDIYGAPGFLAAYNAGPARLDDYLSNTRALPDETRRYVAIIGPRLAGAEPRVRSPAAAYAMNELPLNIPRGTRYGRGGAPTYAYTYNYGNQPNPAPVSAPAPAPAPAPIVTAQLPLPAPAPYVASTPYVPSTPYVAPTPVAAPTMVLPPPEPPRVAYAPQTGRQRVTFTFIPSAQAAEPPMRHVSGESGQWAIQVGAYANQNQAHAALNTAKGHARELAVARAYVGMVHQAHATLWRARLTGLSHEAAVQACQKLLHGHTSCVVLSPEAQS
jgi:Transglycosylase SLT domain/SPOR domain